MGAACGYHQQADTSHEALPSKAIPDVARVEAEDTTISAKKEETPDKEKDEPDTVIGTLEVNAGS